MAELKTKPGKGGVDAFVRRVPEAARREDCLALMEMLRKATRAAPKMWGPRIIGFGDCRCRYPSGREIDWFPIGFASRKQDLTLYFLSGLDPYRKILAKLGKHKTGKGCLHIRKLADVDLDVLRDLIRASLADVKARRHDGP